MLDFTLGFSRMPAIYFTSLTPGAGNTAVALGVASLARAAGRKVGYAKLAPTTPRDLDVDFASTQGIASTAPFASGFDLVAIDGPLASAAASEAATVLVVHYQPGLDIAAIAAACDPFKGKFLGIVLNAVPELALPAVKTEIVPALTQAGLTVLGLLPEDRQLLARTVHEYNRRLAGKILNSAENADALVENILVGAMVTDSSEFYYSRRENKALITRGDRPDLQWNALEGSTRCLILTAGIDPIPYVLDKAQAAGIPVLVVPADTRATLEHIAAFPSPAFHHPAKVERIAQLLRTHAALAALGLQAALA